MNNIVTLHYDGVLVTGTIFDSTYERGSSLKFPVNQLVRGWIEALSLMDVGAKAEFICPPHLAYAEKGCAPYIAPGATLFFDAELIAVE